MKKVVEMQGFFKKIVFAAIVLACISVAASSYAMQVGDDVAKGIGAGKASVKITFYAEVGQKNSAEAPKTASLSLSGNNELQLPIDFDSKCKEHSNGAFFAEVTYGSVTKYFYRECAKRAPLAASPISDLKFKVTFLGDILVAGSDPSQGTTRGVVEMQTNELTSSAIGKEFRKAVDKKQDVEKKWGTIFSGTLAYTASGAGGGAAVGAAIGVWFFGVGVVPGAWIGAAVGGVGTFLGKLIANTASKIYLRNIAGINSVSIDYEYGGKEYSCERPVDVTFSSPDDKELESAVGKYASLAKTSQNNFATCVIEGTNAKYYLRITVTDQLVKWTNKDYEIVLYFMPEIIETRSETATPSVEKGATTVEGGLRSAQDA